MDSYTLETLLVVKSFFAEIAHKFISGLAVDLGVGTESGFCAEFFITSTREIPGSVGDVHDIVLL